MKDLFDDIVGKISVAADQMGKKADEVIETQKIKNKIRGLEKSNRRDFRELGRIVYAKYKCGEIVDEAYLNLCESICEREAELTLCEEELENVKED